MQRAISPRSAAWSRSIFADDWNVASEQLRHNADGRERPANGHFQTEHRDTRSNGQNNREGLTCGSLLMRPNAQDDRAAADYPTITEDRARRSGPSAS